MENKLKIGCTYRIWMAYDETPYTGILTEVLPGWVAIEVKSEVLYINMHHVEALMLVPQ